MAVIGGLVERQHPGKRKTGRQVSFSTDLIYDVLRKYEPDHLLLRAAWDDARTRMSLRGRHVSRRCFVASATKLILPAYGAFTGGLDAGHPEILKKVGPGASALVPSSDRLLRFPIAA